MCQMCRNMEHRMEIIKTSNIPEPDKEDLLTLLQNYWDNQLEHASD